MLFALYQGGLTHSVEDNVRLLEEKAQEAADNGAKLIAFSELFLCGYHYSEGQVHALAVTKDGPEFERISAAAKKGKIWILYGYSEKVQNGATVEYYNSAALVSPSGELAANYRKIHLYSDYERKYFTPGTEFAPIIDVEGMKVGMLICWDFEFPENVRILALQGANFVVVPTANQSLFTSQIMARTRAFENQIFVAYVNRVGVEHGMKFCGDSVCVASNGDDLARASEKLAELKYAKIEPNRPEYIACKEFNPYFQDRVPSVYSLLLKK